jgi:hypothetical protein
VPVAVHPLLEFNVYERYTPLNWDVSRPLSSITIREGRRDLKGKGKATSLVPADLGQSVTDPALEEMDVYINGMDCWKPVHLAKGKSKSKGSPRLDKTSPTGKSVARGAITLGEFIEGVAEYLMTPVSAREYNALPHQRQYAVSSAFNARCFAAGKDAEAVRTKGLMRVDFLGGSNQFATLTQSKTNPLVWLLYTQVSPRQST